MKIVKITICLLVCLLTSLCATAWAQYDGPRRSAYVHEANSEGQIREALVQLEAEAGQKRSSFSEDR